MNHACLANFGMDKNINDNLFEKLISLMIQKGKVINGYYGCDYINYYFKDIHANGEIGTDRLQFVLNVEESKDKREVKNLDIHQTGPDYWKFRIIDDLNYTKKDCKTETQLLAKEINGINGLAVVNVLNADVLPSFLPEEEVELQVVAIGHDVDYYDNIDDYNNNHEGEISLDKGLIFAEGFMYNHQVLLDGSSRQDVDFNKDDLVLIRGKVNRCVVLDISFDEKYSLTRYIASLIETKYGVLPIVHSFDDIKEDQRNKIHEGSEILAYCTLQGDALINEYENGLVLDYDNNLKALRYSLVEKEAIRLKNILDENVIYKEEDNENEIKGAKNLIEFIDKNRESKKEKIVSEIRQMSIDGVEKNVIVFPYDGFIEVMYIELNVDNKVKEINIFRINEKQS